MLLCETGLWSSSAQRRQRFSGRSASCWMNFRAQLSVVGNYLGVQELLGKCRLSALTPVAAVGVVLLVRVWSCSFVFFNSCPAPAMEWAMIPPANSLHGEVEVGEWGNIFQCSKFGFSSTINTRLSQWPISRGPGDDQTPERGHKGHGRRRLLHIHIGTLYWIQS